MIYFDYANLSLTLSSFFLYIISFFSIPRCWNKSTMCRRDPWASSASFYQWFLFHSPEKSKCQKILICILITTEPAFRGLSLFIKCWFESALFRDPAGIHLKILDINFWITSSTFWNEYLYSQSIKYVLDIINGENKDSGISTRI